MMDRQDRKRAFSKAFQPDSHNFGDVVLQAARSVAASPIASTPSSFCKPSTSFRSNKENETPNLQGRGTTLVAPGAPQAGHYQQQGLTPLVNPKREDYPLLRHALQDLSKQQYTGHDTSGQMLPPPTTSSVSRVTHFNLPTPPAAQYQPLLSSSPPESNFECNSALDETLGAYVNSESGPVIHQDPDTMMHDQHIPSGPLTPSELNLQDLSLLDVPKRTSYPAFPSRPVVQRNRASVYVVQSVVFDEYFSEILPNEVIIAFDRGKQVMKVDKYLLCNESRFFAKMLDGPFIHAHTRYIRLRDDFPYAIVAAVQFIETGIYIFDPNMRTKHPHITLLDLHIHAYLVGSKYDMPRLCDHAIAEYINVAQMILSLGVTSDTTCPSGPNECSPSAVTDRFLDSLVLLWKNTPNRYDPMREAVLELIKPALNMLLKLRFFVTLMMELVPFGDDIMHSLAEDGLDVKAFPLPAGVGRMWVVRFGEL